MKSHGKSKNKKVLKKTPARNSTSWGHVAVWYEEHLSKKGTYHETVMAPNVLRLLAPQKGKPILEIGCGEGYFTRLLKGEGHSVVGSDIAKELIEKAREHEDHISYHTASAAQLLFSADSVFSAVFSVLALQNMDLLDAVFLEIARVLQPRGRFIMVINHPAFRVPKRSSWGFDERANIQYRRLDGYLTASQEKINMAPGRKKGEKHIYTYSSHRSLQEYSKALRGAGFVILRIEEWTSPKVSQVGPRAQAEDRARKEFPLFLAIEAIKIAAPHQLQ